MHLSALHSFMRYMHAGGDLMWVVLALTLISSLRHVRLTRCLRRGERVSLTAWAVGPAVLAGVGGLAGVRQLRYGRGALAVGFCDNQEFGAAHLVSNAHNPPILALTLASALCLWSAARIARVVLPSDAVQVRRWVGAWALGLALATLSWRLDLGELAILASGILTPLGLARPPSNEPPSPADLRASASAALLSALGVTAAWTASAFTLAQRQLRARLVLDSQEWLIASGKVEEARRALEALTIPPSHLALALPATLSCLLVVGVAARELTRFARAGEPRTRRELVACVALVALAAALIVAAGWRGPFLEERLAKLPALVRM